MKLRLLNWRSVLLQPWKRLWSFSLDFQRLDVLELCVLLIPAAGRPRAVRFADLTGYRGLNVFEPFGRFRIYYRVIEEELHAERLLEGHRLAASDDRW